MNMPDNLAAALVLGLLQSFLAERRTGTRIERKTAIKADLACHTVEPSQNNSGYFR